MRPLSDHFARQPDLNKLKSAPNPSEPAVRASAVRSLRGSSIASSSPQRYSPSLTCGSLLSTPVLDRAFRVGVPSPDVTSSV
jgi:hypothetical protein